LYFDLGALEYLELKVVTRSLDEEFPERVYVLDPIHKDWGGQGVGVCGDGCASSIPSFIRTANLFVFEVDG
jgi:hypothetical protein